MGRQAKADQRERSQRAMVEVRGLEASLGCLTTLALAIACSSERDCAEFAVQSLHRTQGRTETRTGVPPNG